MLTLATGATALYADEIRLKDGKKLHGVIVAYEDNMFKVKTDFGFVLVEKDKIAAILPEAPAAAATAKPEAKARPKPAPVASAAPATQPVPAAAHDERPEARTAPKTATAELKTAVTPAATPAAPPPAKEEPLPNKEEIQGNLYINHEFGFRMYKAPSWQIIDGAGQALPNAIVAMGTSNESTLLVVGREKAQAALDSAAGTVERRLHDVYENYRLISQRKTVVAGQPALEYRYRGLADGHDWSGTLVVLGHGSNIFTVLGMTFADTDLIQIQENVIARSIASLDFSVR